MTELMRILYLLGGRVFSGAEITTLRFARKVVEAHESAVCAHPVNAAHVRRFGLKAIPWVNRSKKGDNLLRASHFVSEPEKVNTDCTASRIRLTKVVKAYKPDLVVACMYPVAMLALPVLAKAGVPLIVHHQLMYNDLPNHPIIKPVRHVSKYARWVIAASKAVEKPLRRSGVRNTKVIYAGVPDGYGCRRRTVRKRSNKDKFQLLAVGTWGPVKGLDYLIKAADLLYDSGGKFKLTVVGSMNEYGSAYADKIRKISKRGRSSGYIRFVGKNDPVRYYETSDALVVPSCEPDPFPTVTIEGMAHCLPVVATATGGLREQVISGETGYLVPPKNVSALVTTIEKLVADYGKSRLMGMMGRERQQFCYSLGSNGRKFASFLR